MDLWALIVQQVMTAIQARKYRRWMADRAAA